VSKNARTMVRLVCRLQVSIIWKFEVEFKTDIGLHHKCIITFLKGEAMWVGETVTEHMGCSLTTYYGI
jgi:hypothetical protein